MNRPILRDYQEACCNSIMEKFKTYQSTMAVLFTSGGKTCIFSQIIEKFLPGKTLVIAGQDSLIWQAKRTLELWTKGKCGVEMANHCANNNPDIVLATWQTLISGNRMPKEKALFDTPSRMRMHKWKPTHFDLIVIDEFHHAMAKSYVKILDYFKLNPNIKILGVTATPKRGDGLALGQICESVAFEYNILEGALDGWLVDIVQHSCQVGGLDYKHLHVTKGDFTPSELKQVLERQETVAGMCHPMLEVMYALKPNTLDSMPVKDWGTFLTGLNIRPRKTLLFTATVHQAEMACEILNRVVPGLAEWVSGKTKKELRNETFQRFEKGETALLANVGITVEGYDCPPVEVIAMGKPTLSITTFIQMLGRGIRVLPGTVEGLKTKEERLAAIAASAKPQVRVIDFKGNTGRHNLITTFDVLGGRMSDKTEQAKKRAAKSNAPKSVLKTLSIAEIELEKERQKEKELKEKLEKEKKSELVPVSKFKMTEVSAFKNNGMNKPMPKMTKFDNNHKPKVAAKLLQYGFPPEKLSVKQGNMIMGVLHRNGWKLPPKEKAWAESFKKYNQPQQQLTIDQIVKFDLQNYLRSQVE